MTARQFNAIHLIEDLWEKYLIIRNVVKDSGSVEGILEKFIVGRPWQGGEEYIDSVPWMISSQVSEVG